MQFRHRQLQYAAFVGVFCGCSLFQLDLQTIGHTGNQGIFRPLEQLLEFGGVWALLDHAASL